MRFRFEQTIDLPRSTVFAFHEDPQHLAMLHRGWTAFRLIRHDGHLHPGSKTWFETTVARILPVVMGFEHTDYEPPHRFGEELIHGPFRKFTHIHEFEERGTGTLVRDLLEVELPWYYGGEVVTHLLISPSLKRAFRFRSEALAELARTGQVVQCVDD